MSERSKKWHKTRKRNIEQNNRWALRLIRKHNFKTEDEASRYLVLWSIGEGTFRRGYRIAQTNLLIKFPMGRDGKIHSRAEMRKLKKLQKYPALRKHLPPVYYFNSKNGVIVMKYYPPHAKKFAVWKVLDFLTTVLKTLTGVVVSDLNCTDNIHIDDGNLVITDLGY